MKRHIIILATLALSLLSIAGCSKLDMAPKDEITDKEFAYTNTATTAQLLAGIYSVMLQEETWSALIPIRMECATDLMATRNVSAGSPQNNSTNSQSTSVYELWTELYKGINAANEFVFYSDKYTPASPTRTQNVSEARFLRAFYYFTLVRLFGDVPLRTTPTDNIYATDIARSSATEVYNFIVSELTQIEPILGEASAVSYGHINRSAAQAALADVYLNLAGELMKNRLPADSSQQEMYEKARDWSLKVIQNGAHDIMASKYEDIFMKQVKQIANPKEQIFELQFLYLTTTSGYRTDNRIGKYNGLNGGPYSTYASFTPAMYFLYEKDGMNPEKDERFDWNVPLYEMGGKNVVKLNQPMWKYPTGSFESMNWNNKGTGKWRLVYANTDDEFKNTSYGGARLSIYRIAEMHLIYAEALNALGDRDNAIKQINIVRSRAGADLYPDPTPLDQSGVQQVIVDERARELCFEGKRRFDLTRWGIYAQKVSQVLQSYEGRKVLSESDKANMMAGYVNFDDSRHNILPVPQREIDNNKLISPADQNNGWGGNRKWR